MHYRLALTHVACAVVLAAPALAQQNATPASLDPAAFQRAKERLLAQARASYLDKTGHVLLPAAEFQEPEASAFAKDIEQLDSVLAQAAYVQGGRGAEDLASYADMVVLVAARLGIQPPESAIPVYRDRLRSKDRVLTPQESQGFFELSETLRQTAFKRRYLYIADLIEKKASDLAQTAMAPAPAPAPAPRPAKRSKRSKKRKGRAPLVAPPEPPALSSSALEEIDWSRAEELASVAEEGAQGYSRRNRRRRAHRCYQWVRQALQESGLWTPDYRSVVPSRIAHRAFSFAWAMNKLETREQQDPFAARKAPLRRLDLRVDPLVIGSIVVFDRSACGFDRRSGHIEIVTSIEPLRASSYKFHDLKLDCLIKAANLGQVHVYVPRRLSHTI